MLAKHAPELLAKLTTELKHKGTLTAPKTGQQAAVATVALMRRTFAKIAPQALVDAFADGDDLWDKFGPRTVEVIADGVRTLRAIWRGAWAAGPSKVAAGKLAEVPHQDLIDLYMRKTWMPSKTLKTIKAVLK
jgi:hypothetical protein